jgi:hypothetical protein
MFIIIILFALSLVLEVMMLFLTNPETASGTVNHLFVILFSVNTGILVGTLYCFLLLGFYFVIKAYSELQNRAFIRRGALLGIFVASILLFKLYNFLDAFIFGFLVLVCVGLELVLSQGKE